MSTDFRLSKNIGLTKAGLIEALAPAGVVEGIPDEPSDGDSFLLSDGENCIWAYPDNEGLVWSFTVFAQASNDPDHILEAIEETCDDEILSEHDEGFFEDEDEGPEQDEDPDLG